MGGKERCPSREWRRRIHPHGALEPAAQLLERLFKWNLQIGLLVSLVAAMALSMSAASPSGICASGCSVAGLITA